MREHADFAYFHADATAKLVINTGYVGNYLIDDQTVVFADDSGKIYTHGGEFGGKQTTINKGEGILVSKSGSEYTLSLDTDWLTLNFKPTSTTVQNPYTLPIASSSTLGGIKTGYTTNDKNYKVLVDSNGNAFVNVPWSGSSNPDGGSSSGVTKEYVDGKVSELTGRLNNIVSEINWQSIFQQYGNSGGPNAGHTEDEIKGIIEQWVKSDDGTQIVWLQLTANDAHGKPAWVSVVAEKADQWITGTQIQQLQDLISLIAGNFDANGNPLEGKWSGIILTAKDEHGKSVIDLAADEVIARNTIIAPAVVATAINSEDITITSKLTATNADITGVLRPKVIYNDTLHLSPGGLIDLVDSHTIEDGGLCNFYTMEYGSKIQLPSPTEWAGLELKFFYPSYRNGERPSFEESPYIYNDNANIYYTTVDYFRDSAHKLYIAPGREVTCRALYGDWYITSGDVKTTSYN